MLPPIHPICALFPMLPEAELEGVAEDIRRRGKLLEQEAKERQRLHSSPERKVAQNCATLLPGGGDERGKSADHAARLLGSPRYIQAAKRIRGMCADLLPHVMSKRKF